MWLWIIVLSLIFNHSWAATLQDGIALFHEKKYSEALTAFQAPENQGLTSKIGELYCQVALGNYAAVDTLTAQAYQGFSNCDKPPEKTGPETQEQNLLTYQCRRHVREIANQMRQTVEQLVRETVSGFFQKIKMLRKLDPFIDALEQVGIDCCQSGFPWECCLDPMLQQLDSWKAFGISDSNPALR
jgi:hypothetical protein